MIRAFESIANYDFGTWMMGIIGAIISGIGVALATLGGIFVAGVTLRQGYILMGFSVVGAVGASLGKFLQTHSTPDQLKDALDTASKESAKSVEQAGKAADAVADAKSKIPEGRP